MASTGPDPSDTLDISLLSISSDKSAIWGPKVPASIFSEINFIWSKLEENSSSIIAMISSSNISFFLSAKSLNL